MSRPPSWVIFLIRPEPASGSWSIRAERAEVSGAQVVVAEQLELVIVRLIRTHGAVAGRLADGLAWPVAMPVF